MTVLHRTAREVWRRSALDAILLLTRLIAAPLGFTLRIMLYLIGLGLSDEKDVTVRGLEAIKGSDRIYLEAYTSILGVGKERLVSSGRLSESPSCSTIA